MNTEEKAAAFDLLARSFTHQWADGSWTWWPFSKCGSMVKRVTREEAIEDLIEWAKVHVGYQEKKAARDGVRVYVPAGLPMPRGPEDGGQLHGQGDSQSNDPGGGVVGGGEDVRGPGGVPGRFNLPVVPSDSGDS